MGPVKITLLGARKVKRLMKNLGDSGARKALRAGIGKALQVIRKAIRKEVPGPAKGIKKAIGSKVKISKKDGVSAKVGINYGKKSGRGYAPHGAMYILGSKERKTKEGASRGTMPANPIVQRGVAKSQKQAQRELKKKLKEVLKKSPETLMLAQLRTWIEANIAEVAALTGPVKVHVSQAAQGTTTDHVVISRLGEDPHNTLSGASGFHSADIDIDCKASTPDAAEALAAAITRDLEPYTGAMGSINCEAVILLDTRDHFEAAKPGRQIDQYVTTLEITLQYS